MTAPRTGWRMLFGGSGPDGMDRRFLRRFLELGGGPREARVAVVPTASEERDETIAFYEESFSREEVRHLEILDVREHEKADSPETLRRLHEATAVMFTGGDQLRLLDVFMGTEFAAELRRRSRDGVVIGGSSAGSMALGDPVILRGEPTAFYEPGAIRHAPGLGLVEGATVDTHLVARGRFGRVVAMVAAYPDTIGLGIDEDTGLEISPEGVATVMGRRVVCVVDGHGADPAPAVARSGKALSVSGLVMHVLAAGDSYDLRARRVRRG